MPILLEFTPAYQKCVFCTLCLDILYISALVQESLEIGQTTSCSHCYRPFPIEFKVVSEFLR